MATKISLLSLSLNLLCHSSINNLNDGNKITIAASEFYDELIQNEISSSIPWRFAMKTRNLDRDTETDVHPRWKYRFQLPSDYLGLYEVYPSYSDYQIFQDKLYSNETVVQIDYQYNAPIDIWPPYFRMFIVYQMASNLAMLVTQKEDTAKIWAEAAKGKLLNARACDSKMSRSKTLKAGSILQSHYGSTTITTLPDGFEV